jgi:hypothetical protein
MRVGPNTRLPILRLAALTVVAFFLHGYHLGVEDAEIYLPAVKKIAHPSLYPYATEFFLAHGHLSLFSPLLAGTAILTHLPVDWTILAWYVASLFGMLLSGWLVAAACFESSRARWSAVLIMTAVLTMPATNTGLLLMDPYLTARSLSTPLTLFTLAGLLERKYALAAVGVLLTAVIHPQMVVYLAFLIGVLWLMGRAKREAQKPEPVLVGSFVGLLPGGFHLAPASGPYREALYSRDYFFLYNWSWYHWVGMLAPLAILAWFWKGNLRGTRAGFARLSFAMIPFGLLSIAAAALISSTPSLDMFARLQPLRTFHLITIVLVLLLGGVIGEFAAKGRPWVIAAVAIPLAVGMFFVARETYPNSPQIEWPSTTSTNAWVNTLLWVRENTPQDAVFAVDSRYFLQPGIDAHGFRAISERSALATYYKDGGVVSLFPDLAEEWKQMSNATYGLDHFQAQDFARLQIEYPAVSWVVVHGPPPPGMNCPYDRQGYAVCRIS